jgi:hypothetical protein
MAEKTWEELTQSEKIEDLRKDIVRVFSALTSIASDVEALRGKVSEVAKNLDSLSKSTKT